MTDKVQLIKEEIERRRKSLPKETEHKGLMAVYGGIAYELTELLQFIDSLTEEPKCIYNRTLEERKESCKYCSAYCTVRIKEEPASEDLEEVITKCYKSRTDLMMTRNQFGELIHRFTEWQHGKDFDDLLQSEMKFPKEFYEKGRFDMRDEMMKDAVGGEYWDGSIYLDNRPTVYKDGDKVKIIICKTEQQ